MRRVTDQGKATCVPASFPRQRHGAHALWMSIPSRGRPGPKAIHGSEGQSRSGAPPARPAEMLPGRLVSTVSHAPGTQLGLLRGLTPEGQGGGRTAALCSEDLSANGPARHWWWDNHKGPACFQTPPQSRYPWRASWSRVASVRDGAVSSVSLKAGCSKSLYSYFCPRDGGVGASLLGVCSEPWGCAEAAFKAWEEKLVRTGANSGASGETDQG